MGFREAGLVVARAVPYRSLTTLAPSRPSTSRRPVSAGFSWPARLGIAGLIGALVGCATPTPTPTETRSHTGGDDGVELVRIGGAAVVRQAPVDVVAFVDAAPSTAGTVALSDPLASVVAARLTAAGLTVVPDEHVATFLRAVLIMAVQNQEPGGLLASAMADRVGVGGALRDSVIMPLRVGTPGQPAALDATAIADLDALAARAVGETQLRLGVTGVDVGDGRTRLLMVGLVPAPAVFSSFARQVAPGAKVSLSGTWRGPAQPPKVAVVDDTASSATSSPAARFSARPDLTLYADGENGRVIVDEVSVGADGTLAVDWSAPTAAGSYRLELYAQDEKDVQREVFGVTFYVGDVPSLVAPSDPATPISATAVLEAINTLREASGTPALEDSALLHSALTAYTGGDGSDSTAATAVFAQSGKLVRRSLSQSFEGYFSLAELETSWANSPWARSMLTREDANALGIIVVPSPRNSEVALVQLLSASVRSHIDDARERQRTFDGVNRSRRRGKVAPLKRDEVLEAKLQTFVEGVCSGAVAGDDHTAMQVALDSTLRKRRYKTIASFASNGPDVPSSLWGREFEAVTSADFNVAAVGACSGPKAVKGAKNGVFVLLVLGNR